MAVWVRVLVYVTKHCMWMQVRISLLTISFLLSKFVGGLMLPRACRPQRGREHVTRIQIKAKNSKIRDAVQTAAVTIMSDLNFARYKQHYGSYMPSSPLGSISP